MNRRNFTSRLAGLMLVEAVSHLHAVGKNRQGPIIVEAGRRVDAPAANAARFPLPNVPKVRKRIQLILESQKPVAVVCAAACGADLLLLDVAGKMKIPRHILLPSDAETFRESSVTDRPGNWNELYDEALRSSKVEILNLPDGQEGYLETNLRLLDRAADLARQERTSVEALVVWNQASRGSDDVTAHFLQQARLREMPVFEVSTL